MKYCVYKQPYKPVALAAFNHFLKFVSKSDEVVVDTLYDFDELLDKVGKGKYDAVFAKDPEDYHNDPLDYLHLMIVALKTNTKVFEINSFNELTSSFLVEQRNNLAAVQTNIIKRHINFIERH